MNTDTENFEGHTPSPLKTEPHALGFRCYVLPDGGKYIENCVVAVTGVKREEIMANALMFAAAPDLLRERNELRETMELMLASASPHPMENGAMYEAWLVARKVLARCGK